jgi:hypothetical protein
MHLLAALTLLSVLAHGALAPLQTQSDSVRLGGEGRLLQVELREGRLRVRDDARRVLYESRASEHVYGYAAAPFLPESGNQLLLWLARRNANRAGVVPHDSGWMDYGSAPWIASHLAFLGVKGPTLVERWVSSAMSRDIEAAFVERSVPRARQVQIVTQERTGSGPELVWYRYGSWSLDVTRRLPVTRARAVGLAPQARTTPAALERVDLMAVGDVMLGRATGLLLARHSYEESLGDVRPLLSTADVALGNLEGCPAAARAGRTALDLSARPEHSRALSYLGLDAMSVANNHCDPGDLLATERWLGQAGVRAVGMPAPGEAFGRPVIIERNGLRLAFVAVNALAGSGASLAALRSAAAEQQLAQIKKGADALIVSVHWGEEYAPTPAPWQRALARFWIDAGADAVLGHHPHVVQEVEEYRGRFVAYSLGNFLFDQEGYVPEAQGATERGLLLHLRFHKRLGWCAEKIGLEIIDRHRVRRVD